MPVIIDTSVWSLGLRRRRKDLSPVENALVFHFEKIISNGDAVLPGVVRQEVLTGIRDESVFDEMRDRLRNFDDAELEVEDYERAAKFANVCRAAGIASNVSDMLICSLANGNNWAVMTTDLDFDRYARCVRIRLHQVPG